MRVYSLGFNRFRGFFRCLKDESFVLDGMLGFTGGVMVAASFGFIGSS
jgi:zinc transporter ZupT